MAQTGAVAWGLQLLNIYFFLFAQRTNQVARVLIIFSVFFCQSLLLPASTE
jgi:hypothetical protein